MKAGIGTLVFAGLLLSLAWVFPTSKVYLVELGEWLGLLQEDSHEYVAVKDEEGNVKYWTCTMHPSVRLPGPGSCPICGMGLVPVKNKTGLEQDDPILASGQPDLAEARLANQEETPSENTGLFTVSTERRQLIGVRYSEISYQKLEKVIRTVGRIELDETKIAMIHPKISGWIEDAFVNYQWQSVQRGDPLYTIYSPQLVSGQEEFLLALKALKELDGENTLLQASMGARFLVEDSRMRLRLWDVSDEQIKKLEKTKQVKRTLTVFSPITGYVINRNAFPGTRVTPETNVYTIADHSTVWVHVDLYEDELAWVRVGQRANMTTRTYPNRIFSGRITFIWPHLDRKTRTLKVRLEFQNQDLALKPEMYTDVQLRIPLGRRLAIPRTAVLPTGTRNLVFVDRGNGQMQVRAITIGKVTGDFYEVLEGLQAGERVVTAANFLIDAESQVQGAIATWQVEPGETTQESSRQGGKTGATKPGGGASSPSQGDFNVEVLGPKRAKVGQNTLRLRVTDSSGALVENAEVEVTLFMPRMGSMAPMHSKAKLLYFGQGEYGGTIDIPMAFSWQTTITIKKRGRVLGAYHTTITAH